jgi:hypothetical protein
MVHVRTETGVTKVVSTAATLRCEKQVEKLPHYYFSWMTSFQKSLKAIIPSTDYNRSETSGECGLFQISG